MYIYRNDSRIHRDDLHIPINDRSFRFGDGAFETIRIADGVPLFVSAHVNRLRNVLAAIRIPVVLDTAVINSKIRSLIRLNQIEQGAARIIISRGSYSIGFLPAPDSEPDVYVTTETVQHMIPEQIDVWLSDIRWPDASVIPVTTGKLNNALHSVLARMQARDHLCFEALCPDLDGSWCEGSSSNFLIRQERTLMIPDSPHKLTGITETQCVQISPYKTERRRISVDDLRTADAMYIMNSMWGVLTVDSIKPLDTHFAKETTDPLIEAYDQLIQRTIHAPI